MMSNNRMTREQLGVKSGDTIIVKGRVAFARLDKLVEGEALARENERRSKLGMLHTKPFRSITIEDPEIVQGQGTPLAQFHGQSVYQNKQNGKNMMTLESKSLYPPRYGHIQNGKIVEIEDPQKNPAQGQIVYIMIQAFKAKGFNNLGSSFNAIVFEEGEIKFYEGGDNVLAGFGQALNMPVETLPQAQPQPIEPQQEPVATPDANAGGFGTAPTPEQNQNTNPFGGFGGAQGQNAGQPAQNPFGGGFDQSTQNPFGGGSGQPAQNPFGMSDQQASQNPFGGNNGGGSPFA